MAKHIPSAEIDQKISQKNDWRIVAEQCMIPISMVITEMGKVDILLTIGRLLLMPAFVVTAIVVIASSPLIGVWARYYSTLDNTEQKSSKNSQLFEDRPTEKLGGQSKRM